VNYLLDTDIVSRIGRSGSDGLTQRVKAMSTDDLAISVVTRGEIEYGLLALGAGRATVERMRGLLQRIATLPLDEQVASHFALVRNHLRAAGTPIGYNDLWIAAHALALKLTLVTHNEREFARVPGLAIETWARD
jgi:tRNA(fMet)-specific endonuclease VapC